MLPDLSPWETLFKHRSFIFHDGKYEIFPDLLLCWPLEQEFGIPGRNKGGRKFSTLTLFHISTWY